VNRECYSRLTIEESRKKLVELPNVSAYRQAGKGRVQRTPSETQQACNRITKSRSL